MSNATNATNVWGNRVTKNGVVTHYEGGIIHSDQQCDTPASMIMVAVAKADWHNMMGGNDMSEVANLLAWCKASDFAHDEIDEWLINWEGESGCHHPHDYAGAVLQQLGW